MNNTLSVTIDPNDNGWMTATGKLPVPFTNDFLFCAMLQKNNMVLKSLICSLMHVFSDKFRISVLCLNQIDLATEEDKAFHIDTWARLFKCTDWREVQMLAKDNPDIKEAVVTIHQLTEDEKVRQMCERREKALFIERSREHFLAETQAQLAEKTAENEQLNSEVERLKKLLAEHNISIDE